MKRFSVPIFGPRIHFTQCPDEALAWINKMGAGPGEGEHAGFTIQAGAQILIFAPDFPILAHEALHAAVMILEHIGDEKRDEEVTAYLVQFIVEKCVR